MAADLCRKCGAKWPCGYVKKTADGTDGEPWRGHEVKGGVDIREQAAKPKRRARASA